MAELLARDPAFVGRGLSPPAKRWRRRGPWQLQLLHQIILPSNIAGAKVLGGDKPRPYGRAVRWR
jgi:hypothetical protein